MSQDMTTKFWPMEIRVNSEDKQLEIDFDNGESFSISAELLRVESPSSEVQGHGQSQKATVAGRRHVGISGVDPVGDYALRIRFDDLHDTGLFSWRYLYEMGSEQDRMWQEYLESLEEQGLSRDP